MENLTEELKVVLEADHYVGLREIEGKGICGLMQFAYTIGLVYGIDRYGYTGRYCYPHDVVKECVVALKLWDGKEDPIGDWIKHKGIKGDITNPKFANEYKR